MRTLIVLCAFVLAATSAVAQTLPPVNQAPNLTIGVSPTLAGTWVVQSIYDGRLTLTLGADGEVTGQFVEDNGVVRTYQGSYGGPSGMWLCRGAGLASFIIVARAESVPLERTQRSRRVGNALRLVGRMYIGVAGPPAGILGQASLEGRPG
jgi:hypothetical protein